MAQGINTEKIKNIEFLRFLFIMMIASLHINQALYVQQLSGLDIDVYNSFINCTGKTSYAVNFFFITAGFFMFMKTDFTQSFTAFAKKKLIRFMPLILSVLGIIFVLHFFLPLDWVRRENLFTMLNLQNTGLTFINGSIPQSWFVSALFWAMCFYFYLYKIIKREFFNLITACLVFFCWAAYLHFPGDTYNVHNCYLVINQGMLQAFAGLGTGYFINMFYQNCILKLRGIKLPLIKTLLITALEIYIFISIFYNLWFHNSSYSNSVYYSILFVILFMLFLARKGLLSILLNNNISVFIGQFTYSIFITHYLARDLWSLWAFSPAHIDFAVQHPVLNLSIVYAAVIFAGTAAYYFIEKPLAEHLIKK